MKQLEIDTSDADEVMVHLLADAAVADGEFSNWDHAYESLWVWLEYELHMQREVGANQQTINLLTNVVNSGKL